MRRAVINTGILAAATGLAGGCDNQQQRCNREPEAPDCIPDAGTVGGLTYRTRQDTPGVDVVLLECGEFVREIFWLIPGGAPADGFVVQQITLTSTGVCPAPSDSDYLDRCTDPPTAETLPPSCIDGEGAPFIDERALVYWELFPMRAGEVRYAGTDEWNLFAQAVAEGEATIEGAARYYTERQMGFEHPGDPASPFQLDPLSIPGSHTVATLTRPTFWRNDDRPTLNRRITVSWTCCPAGPTRVEEDTHDR